MLAEIQDAEGSVVVAKEALTVAQKDLAAAEAKVLVWLRETDPQAVLALLRLVAR